MEHILLKINVSGITYSDVLFHRSRDPESRIMLHRDLIELIPPFWCIRRLRKLSKRAGLIRADNLRSTSCCRKLCVH
jgi:hypothetical protein